MEEAQSKRIKTKQSHLSMIGLTQLITLQTLSKFTVRIIILIQINNKMLKYLINLWHQIRFVILKINKTILFIMSISKTNNNSNSNGMFQMVRASSSRLSMILGCIKTINNNK